MQVTDNNEVFTSSDPNFWDHVRQKDITKNSGIEPNDFHSSIVKELLDNAADFHERNHIDGVIIVHSTRNNDLFQISVRNSNPNDFHSSIVKELLDNAADFHERNHIDGVIIVHSTRNN